MCGTELPHVGYAVAADLGDPASPWDPVHSRRKQEVPSTPLPIQPLNPKT
jgi:hypothetical protein